MNGVFTQASPNSGPVREYQEQNEKILEELGKKYEVLTYHSLEHAAYQMTHDDVDQCSDASFMITNIPYAVQIPRITVIHAEKTQNRLEGLVEEEETEFSAYGGAFECLRKLKKRFPKMKIIAYSAAHETVRRKVYEDDLVFSVHRRGHQAGPVWERVQLIEGIARALEGWRRCD